MFASIGGFGERATVCCQPNFSPSNSRCHGNKIWDITG